MVWGALPRRAHGTSGIPGIVVLPLGWAGTGDADLEDIWLGVQAHLSLKAAKAPTIDGYSLVVDVKVLLHILDAVDQVFYLRLTDLLEIGFLE